MKYITEQEKKGTGVSMKNFEMWQMKENAKY